MFHKKAMLARIGKGAKNWIALTNGVIREGRAPYRAVGFDADLEGIVAKPPGPTPTTRSSPAGTRS